MTVDREFTVVRTLSGTPAEVFAAWTDPSQLIWFLNPDTTPLDEPITVDLRVGGQWRLRMKHDDLDYVTGGIYREIVPNERLVFEWGAVDGWPLLDPEKPDDAPIVTLAFRDNGDGTTTQTLHSSLPESMSETRATEWMSTGMLEGWGMTIDRLVSRLAVELG
jgi:uncharacterized protein YndB with AHSA1/START domain